MENQTPANKNIVEFRMTMPLIEPKANLKKRLAWH
jgi:hypothetical protein